ncbi:MmcQ/YjbR family DNA-binding protein [Micropruina sonneratiae]|uniref:MmcQ/YjbR family DNA-binding protein n=1 Tax=Micropruina sonneratiae TaxID=2986940 RepID=UPI002227AD6A|nr:MmcQ/YjbR family DNA-binding protein [Micropruina sp. KQZ13P-5]MCW3156495.1 MmcQ/YjbR family DNA-binding protein [Micropruina sp. KQZ13P-5]
MDADREATEADIHALAAALPHVTVHDPGSPTPVYQVGGKSFVFFRTPRPDAFDPDTGRRFPDVVVFWVPDFAVKEALVQDRSTPFFTTPHFDGHPSVLLRHSRVGELSRGELAEVIEDAWLTQASARRGRLYLEGTDRITD